jgi:methionyl aminopeptidase
MIHYKSQEEIELIRQSCLIVSAALTRVAELLKAGTTGLEVDAAAEEVIRDHGAVPAFKGHHGFPATLCISRNACVVHGIPDEFPFKEGDIVSVDCGAIKQEFYGDSAYTFAIGNISQDVEKLLEVTQDGLYLGIQQAIEGNRVGDISFAVQEYCERKHHYGVVRELVGHGIGRQLHEGPEVPNYGRRGAGPKLKSGMVIAIEPMINLGGRQVTQMNDGWTILTKDRRPSAHFEHTVSVKKERAEILSDHSGIEVAIKNNPNLKEISKNN